MVEEPELQTVGPCEEHSTWAYGSSLASFLVKYSGPKGFVPCFTKVNSYKKPLFRAEKTFQCSELGIQIRSGQPTVYYAPAP